MARLGIEVKWLCDKCESRRKEKKICAYCVVRKIANAVVLIYCVRYVGECFRHSLKKYRGGSGGVKLSKYLMLFCQEHWQDQLFSILMKAKHLLGGFVYDHLFEFLSYLLRPHLFEFRDCINRAAMYMLTQTSWEDLSRAVWLKF